MMSTKVKRIAALAAACLGLLALSGCGGDPQKDTGKAAAVYVEGLIAATFQGDEGALPAAEGQLLRSRALEIGTDTFAAYFDLRLLEEETQGAVTALYQNLYAAAGARVGKTTQTTEGWSVEVTLTPTDILGRSEQAVNAYVDAFNARYRAGEFQGLSKEAREDVYAREVLSIVEEELQGAGQGELRTVTLHPRQDEEGNWSLSEEEFAALCKAMVQ